MHNIKPVLFATLLLFLGITNHAGSRDLDRLAGQYALTVEPRTIIATSLETWKSMVGLTGDSSLVEERFDPENQTGIGIFLGSRNTGGHTVDILSMGPKNGRFVVVVDEKSPGADEMTTQSLTSPWLIILIDRPDLPISIEPRFHAL